MLARVGTVRWVGVGRYMAGLVTGSVIWAWGCFLGRRVGLERLGGLDVGGGESRSVAEAVSWGRRSYPRPEGQQLHVISGKYGC
jgi:hypothetical protein